MKPDGQVSVLHLAKIGLQQMLLYVAFGRRSKASPDAASFFNPEKLALQV
jgi:hypothetical protein